MCTCLMKLLKMDYKKIGLNQIQPLPKWLNCEIVDGNIYLWGIPKFNDEPELLIRIYDHRQFVVYSYFIIIQDENGGDLRNKSYVRTRSI